MRTFRKFFKYKKHRLIYKVGKLLLTLIPSPEWVTVKSPYGVIIMPKDFRIFSTMFDLVEPEIQDIFERCIKDVELFIDVGASYGWYVLKARKLNPQLTVVAIEPDIVAVNVLRANLAINGLLDEKIKIVNLACSDRERVINVKTCVPTIIKKGLAKRLDTIVKQLGLKVSNKTLILIDVEGHGMYVLRGAAETLKHSKPKIIMELHPGEKNVKIFLESLGYTVSYPSENFIMANKIT